jgi:hypothetical protein
MKQQKFIFCRYSFQEDPDTIPDKRVAIEEIRKRFTGLFHAGEKLTMYMKKLAKNNCKGVFNAGFETITQITRKRIENAIGGYVSSLMIVGCSY